MTDLTFTKNGETYGIERALSEPKRHRLVGNDYVYLDVRSATSASWVFWYRFGGEKPELGLGSAFDRNNNVWFGGKAKSLATVYAGKLEQGENPKRHKRSGKTFGELLEEQIGLELKSKPTWGEADTWRRYGKLYFPGLLKLAPKHIDRHRVVQELNRKRDENPTTTDRARNVIETVMGYARDWELCAFTINPAEKTLIDSLMGSRASTDQEERVSVAYADMPALILRVLCPKTSHWRLMGNARKALLCAASIPHRTAEIVKMKRADVDLRTGTWKTPVEDNKKRNVQVNILPWQVVEVLRSIPEVPGNPYFFVGGTVKEPTDSHISEGRMREILQKELKVEVDVDGELKLAHVHGFRSSMVTFAGETRGVDRDTLKGMLSHRPSKGKKKKEALDHYLRPENIAKRAAELQAWCDAIYPADFGQDVVTLRAA